jgi:ligand-binding sensor domain-containing protein
MALLEVTAVSVYGDEVWFGTDDGVEMLDQASGVWKGFPAAHFPTDENMHVILADSQAVWAGTDNGVLKYNREEDRWRLFSTEDGLAGNSVRWILPDGDTIWFGTDRGLTRFYWNAPYRMD